MFIAQTFRQRPRLVAVNVSPGGIPKQSLSLGVVTRNGLVGDLHAHDKHDRSDRAISLLDLEIVHQLTSEGFALGPGVAGENLTVAGIMVQQLEPGTRIQMGDVVLRLEMPRKPCYVLDAIHAQLKEAIVGRCGYMASVEQEGTVRPGDDIRILTSEPAQPQPETVRKRDVALPASA